MTIALIDNGSLEPDAHRNLRRVARALSERAGTPVHAVSWRHSDKISSTSLDGVSAPTLGPWLRTGIERGERDFVFVPFFISAQGAIGSALRGDLHRLQQDRGGFDFAFTQGLADRNAIVPIVAARIRERIADLALHRPVVIVVDHGGPSPASGELRNQLAAKIQIELGSEICALAPASLEGVAHAHNRPLLAELLGSPGYDQGHVVIAPLFLSPGRHAGPAGDLAQIARTAETRVGQRLRCHFTGLVGTHPLATTALAAALDEILSRRQAGNFARL